MIYEIRTYRVKVGSLAEVEKRFGEGYEYRKTYSLGRRAQLNTTTPRATWPLRSAAKPSLIWSSV